MAANEPEPLQGRAATLTAAITQIQQMRGVTYHKLAVLDRLVEALHTDLRQVLREQWEKQ